MNYKEEINKITLLSDEDKVILLKACNPYNSELLKSMSIFYNNGEYKQLNDYKYYETKDGDDIYFINSWFPNMSLFVDKDKKILINSR